MNSGTEEQRVVQITEAETKNSSKKKKISIYDVAVRLIGFLLARAELTSGITPFGVAFLSAERRFTVKTLVGVGVSAIGYISLGDTILATKYIGAMLIYLVFLFAVGREDTDISLSLAVCASGVAVATANIGVMIWEGFSFGGFIVLLCDVALVCLASVVFERSRGLLHGRKTMLFTMNVEQKMCFAILAAIVLLGLGNIEIGEYLSADKVVGLWLTAVLTLSGGTSAAVCAAAIGLIVGLWDDVLMTSSVFVLCSVVGGFGVKFGKMATTLIMALCTMTIFFLGGAETTYFFGYADIPVFVALMLITPDYIIRIVGRITGIRSESSNEVRTREYIKSRLDAAASSFRTLADTFLDLSDKEPTTDIEDVSNLFDGVADRVCRECSRLSECWVNNFNVTYRSMFHMLEVAEKRGELTESDADENFSRKCLRLRALVREMNRLFEIYKINCVWKSKLCENRELAGQQLAGIGQILDDISQELCEDKPDVAAEEEIRMRLVSKGIEVGALNVTINPKGRYSAYVEICDEEELGTIKRIVESVVKAVLGVRLSVMGAIETENGATLRLAQLEGYRVETGCAKVGKYEECGDNYVMRYINGGKYAAALSDGMGTGHAAARDSGATVKLLGDFLEAGFDKSVAVRLVNSIMVMKSATEAFATVDMCVIDLFGGDAEFIKNGAEPSYIKRNGQVETVRAASLPVGIMQEMEVESFAHRLCAGDIVVMTSDGLQMKKGHEEWIRTMVEEADENMPPGELADRIVDMANTLHGGEADDDMTVMVIKLVER